MNRPAVVCKMGTTLDTLDRANVLGFDAIRGIPLSSLYHHSGLSRRGLQYPKTFLDMGFKVNVTLGVNLPHGSIPL